MDKFTFLNRILICLSIIFVFFGISNVQSQDTITLQTFTWDSTSRSAYFNFPDIPSSDIERINMIYNMRCHGAVVGNGQTGCKEWDYSCNTFLTDTNRLDSSLAYYAKYVIPNFSGSKFLYSNFPTNGCISISHSNTTVDSISDVNNLNIGQASGSIDFNTSNSKYYLLYKRNELINSNMMAGKVNALRFESLKAKAQITNLKIRMKNTNLSNLDNRSVQFDNFEEVYYSNTQVNSAGVLQLLLNNSFEWDGTSDILIELSYNNITGDGLELSGFSSLTNTLKSVNKNYSLLQNGNKGFSIDKTKLSSISSEITISFWSNGTRDILPTNTVVFEGVDANNNRQVNVHLPWSNGSIYWDCGNDGTGYDRIEKAASPEEYKGNWIHWAFTKNTSTGVMNIYKNGKLWMTASGKKKNIQIEKMIFGGNINDQISYYGRLKQFCIWNKELDSTSIQNWILQPGNPAHPNFANLVYYFPLNEQSIGVLTDLSPNPKSIITNDIINWYEEKGRDFISDFEIDAYRPIISFVQGNTYGFHNNVVNVLEEYANPIVPVSEYEIKKGKAVVKQIYPVYIAGDQIIKNETGDSVGVKKIASDGTFNIETLKYQSYSPGKYELLSLVSPYGINLDLSKEGKNFVFDVTDYAPLLRGSKKLSMELGGENQEEFNIKFQFIKGKSAREVIDIQNVYTFNRGYFGNILRDEVFEPRLLETPIKAKLFKLRTTITGHDQNGEFTNISHYLTVTGNKGKAKFDFDVWKECANNPIYPQGGTWIFDRAGWCPGAPSDVHDFNVSSLMDGGSQVGIDYGLNSNNLDAANYLVSCQLVSYGDYNYKTDAGLESIVRPNSERVEFERFNPSCSRPSIQVKNYGSSEISKIEVKYQVTNGDILNYTFNGRIKPLETQQIDLPINNMSFWNSSKENQFKVEIIKVNDIMDENPRNNISISKFKLVKTFDVDPVFEIRTNKVDGDNSYQIRDMNGNVLIDMPNLPASSTIQENLKLPNGCYTLEVTDQANDGLSFWFFPDLGSGSLGFKRKVGASLVTIQGFKPDFGSGIQFDFIMNKINSVVDSKHSYLLSLYPNPCYGEINIALQSTTLSDAKIKIFSNSGKLIINQNWGKTDYRNFDKINLKNLDAGLYFVQIQMQNEVITRKIIVENY